MVELVKTHVSKVMIIHISVATLWLDVKTNRTFWLLDIGNLFSKGKGGGGSETVGSKMKNRHT